MAAVVRFEGAKCSACNACAVACIDENDLTTGDGRMCAYRFVEECEKQQGGTYQFFQKMHGCMHCENAPCINACPCGCLKKDEQTGLVLPDNTNCIGCQACKDACPFDAIRINKEGKMEKCDGCIDRLRQGLRPACEQICPPRAIVFKAGKSAE